MKYEIDDEFGGVPEGLKYQIEDTQETEQEWKNMLSSFSKVFSSFTSMGYKDYAFPDWHYGMRSLAVYLHNEAFLNEDFLPKVTRILENQKHECFAQFECFDSSKRLVGRFMVFKDIVIFDRSSEKNGLIGKLKEKGCQRK